MKRFLFFLVMVLLFFTLGVATRPKTKRVEPKPPTSLTPTSMTALSNVSDNSDVPNPDVTIREITQRPKLSPKRIQGELKTAVHRGLEKSAKLKNLLLPPREESELPPLKHNPEGVWLRVVKSRHIAYLMEDDTITRSFRCAVGKTGPEGPDNTPTGRFMIMDIKRDPIWRPSPRVRKDCKLPLDGVPIPPYSVDPRNALGTWRMQLSCGNGILLHGTNNPARIGTSDTHGCVSFLNEDIEVLASELQTGAPVVIED